MTAAQINLSSNPIWKVVLSRTSQTTRGYDNTRVIKIAQVETPDGDNVEVVLNNSDAALTSLDFEHYQAVISYGYKTGISRSAWAVGTVYAVDDIVIPVTANGYQYRCSVAGTSHAATEPTWPTDLGVTVADNTVTWEMDGYTGDEYSRTAPLRVRVQELHSGRGILRCILRPEGLIDQLKEDKATTTIYTQDASNQSTVKTLITAIAVPDPILASYDDYPAITVTYDSQDSIIDSFIPADYFSVSVNESRGEKILELLGYTGCKAREGNDGALHILDPVTTGTTYAYEYKFNVSGDHNFWSKSIRLRFINPNKEVVSSHPTEESQYSGNNTSATSYALAPKIHTSFRRLTSSAEADAIAAAIIESRELDAEKGTVTVPMNVGQELWDYVKVTDSRENDSIVGNIQYIQRNVEVHFDGRPLTWTMMISLGKVSPADQLVNLMTAGNEAQLSSSQILSLFKLLTTKQDELIEGHNKLVDKVDDLLDVEAVFRKVTVTNQLIIPNWDLI